MKRVALLACLLATPAFAQSLTEKLAPPKTIKVAPPSASEQQPRTKSEELPVQQTRLPAAELNRDPRVLPGESKRTRVRYAAVDAPALAAESNPLKPDDRKLPTGPAVRINSTDARQTPPLRRFDRVPEPAPQLLDDPTMAPAHDAVIGPRVLPTLTPPSPLKLAVPDPFAYVQRVRLKETPPDNDPPINSVDRPEKPVLTPPPAPPAK